MLPELLANSIGATCLPGVPLYVLIDPILGEPFPTIQAEAMAGHAPTDARAQVWGRPIHPVPLFSTIDLPVSLHPYLVALEGPKDPLIEASAALAIEEWVNVGEGGLSSTGSGPHRVGGWLHSSLPPEDLAHQLARMMQVSTTALTSSRYQRLADRRVLDWLRQTIGDERLSLSLGRIQAWLYLDACSTLQTLFSKAEAAAPLSLTPLQWHEFVHGAKLHALVARWTGARQTLASTSLMPECDEVYQMANDGLKSAEAASRRWPYRFQSESDHSSWAVLCMLHPGLNQRSPVISLMNRPQDDEAPLQPVEALSDMLHSICQDTQNEHKYANSGL